MTIFQKLNVLIVLSNTDNRSLQYSPEALLRRI